MRYSRAPTAHSAMAVLAAQDKGLAAARPIEGGMTASIRAGGDFR